MHMKKNFLLLGLLAFVAFFISSCSQEDVVNDTKGASPESIKVEKMTNLFKTYNWNHLEIIIEGLIQKAQLAS